MGLYKISRIFVLGYFVAFCAYADIRGRTPFYDRQNCSQWLVKLPKVVLHHHLDGSLRPETILDLAQKENIDLGVPLTLEDVRNAATVTTPQKDLIAVLQRFWFFQKVFRSYDAIKRITLENIEDLYRDGVRLAELRFAPAFMANGLGIGPEEILNAVVDGVLEGKKQFPDMEIGLIHIIVRSHAGANVAEMEEMNRKSLLHSIKFRKSSHPGAGRLVGLDFAGSEIDTPTQNYVEFAKLGLENGLQITVHSGEDSSPERILQSVELLHASRIGHGVQIWADHKLLTKLREKGIHFEVSPTSNWITNHIPGKDVLAEGRTPNHLDLKHHPIVQMWKAGLSLSIEGDDPQLFGIGVVHEYQLLHYLLGMKKVEFESLNRRAASKSFLPEELKAEVISCYFSKK